MPPRGSLRSFGLTAAICERFADGQPHALDAAVAAVGHLIYPEVAVRTYQRRKTSRAGGIAEQIERGRCRIIRKRLAELGAEPLGAATDRWATFRLPRREVGRRLGERHPHARLTEAQVREIRRRVAAGGVSYTHLGREYGVSDNAIRQIARRRVWTHVE